MRRTLLALLAIAVLAAAAGALYVRHWLAQPLAIGSGPVIIEVEPGQSLTAVSRQLAARGLLRHPRLLALYGRFIGADSRMHAGEFSIKPGTSPRGLLQVLVSGAVVQHSVTVVEGWTFRDLRKALAAQPTLEHTTRGMRDDAVMRALGEDGKPAEGLFFPDTYLFGKGTRDLDLLRQSRDRMRRELAAAWETRHENLPLKDEYEALVLASIIERETGHPDERARIAGVFVERLRRGMRLQTDPTVIYGLGEKFDGNLRRSDLERDGPYNTYTRAGLPPTPIALPGAASLRAAVQPDERGELFFVATGEGDGRHAFSKSLAEHEAAVRRYLVRYRQNHGKGR
ncbi:MAG: endolytic transglycosylase MltG [Gammaproteobacteria bacterium]|nr:endolytic transglycosylase MltG [Gammaproteobacteria bacterium]MDH5272750.1 endolytic transglycosylase MltG [Gammaproteobacteria bacterium]